MRNIAAVFVFAFFFPSFGSADVELGLGLGVSVIPVEGEISPSAHLHVSREFSCFILGVSSEVIADEHGHINFSVILGLRLGHVKISYLPGITFFPGEGEFYLSQHGEISYLFDIGERIHLGPMLSAGYEFGLGVFHITAGVHIGFEI